MLLQMAFFCWCLESRDVADAVNAPLTAPWHLLFRTQAPSGEHLWLTLWAGQAGNARDGVDKYPGSLSALGGGDQSVSCAISPEFPSGREAQLPIAIICSTTFWLRLSPTSLSHSPTDVSWDQLPPASQICAPVLVLGSVSGGVQTKARDCIPKLKDLSVFLWSHTWFEH